MKSGIVRTDGYYASGPAAWEDWHAGVHMRETHYHFWRFYQDGTWVRCDRYEPDFAFWQFTGTLQINEIEKAKRDGTAQIEEGFQLFVVGTYAIHQDILTTVFEWQIPLHPSGEQVFCHETRYRVVGERLVPLEKATGYPLRFIAQSPANKEP